MAKLSASYTIANKAPLGPEAQAAVLERPDLRMRLAHNPNVTLAEGVWEELWAAKPQVGDALALVQRELTAEQVSWVLANEKRSTVLGEVIAYSNVEEDELAELLQGRRAAAVAKAIPDDYPLTPALADRVTTLIGGMRRLEFLATAPSATAQAAREFLATWKDDKVPRPSAERSRSLTKLLYRFPELVEVYTLPEAHESLACVAAGSVHLTTEALQRRIVERIDTPGTSGFEYDDMVSLGYTLMAFAANPVVDPALVDEVARLSASDVLLARVPDACHRRTSDLMRPQVHERFDEVDDEVILDWLLRRCTPYQGQTFANNGRPFDLEILARNPHLGFDRATSVVYSLSYPVIADVLGARRAKAAIDAVCANHPEVIHRWPQLSPVQGRRNYPRRRCSPAPTPDGSWEQPKERLSVEHLFGFGNDALLGWIASDGVVASRPAWRVLLTLLDDANHEESLADLVEAANTLA